MEGKYIKKSLGPFVLACILVGLIAWGFITGRVCLVDGLTVELIVPEPLGPEFYSEMRKININFIFLVLVPTIHAILAVYYLVIGKLFDDGDALDEHQLEILDRIVGLTILALILIEIVAFQIAWSKGTHP